LEVVTKELDETKAERKKVTDQLGVLFKQREALQKEIDELKTDLDNRKKVFKIIQRHIILNTVFLRKRMTF
jgi:peptidoglycan hydrolase CwlO-like protein